MRQRSIDTKLVHGDDAGRRVQGAVVTPIFQSAMFESSAEAGDETRYIRYFNTPNQVILHEKLASLEGGEEALVTASGMAAITASVLSITSPGDHILAQKGLYAGTHILLTRDMPHWGISVDFIDDEDPGTWEGKLRPNTRAIITESISNPLMRVISHDRVTGFARKHGLISLIDNTFTTPVNFRPLEWGYDVSLHSGTKYLNGHSDIVAGAVVGTPDFIATVRDRSLILGGSLDPHACFLLERGLKTLAVRVRRQNQSAIRIATYLQEHPSVQAVHYPGLHDHPQHERAQRFFGGCGGMLSFDLAGGAAAAELFMPELTIPIRAGSLGGVETLVTRPALTSHAGIPEEERRELGIGDGLIRMSVGIEDPDDLLEDLDNALAAI